ncbi:MAG TPA: hypothetical protein VK966_10915, partial [Longimicrobiales bacterium]|nr:hypothetical protein [Longimicrobiales bacterium]
GGRAALDAAVEAGAWAATISGAGSGLIAACPPDEAARVAEAMAASFRASGDPEGIVHFAARPDRTGLRVEEVAWR